MRPLHGLIQYWLPTLATISLCGCSPRIPANANPLEADAVAILKPLAEHISWDNDGNVSSVDLSGATLSNDLIGALNSLEHLQELNLSGVSLTDAQLAQLRPKGVRSFSLAWTGVTDAGLAQLEAYADLVLLDISGTQVSDSGVRHLQNLTKLNWLFIADTRITDQGESLLRASLPHTHLQSTVGDER